MRVHIFKNNPKVYSCKVYLVRGDWNAISDVNTLIDVGTDGFIISELEEISTGVGKKRVDQVILTHEHFDHSSGLKVMKEKFSPIVYSYSLLGDTDYQITDGMSFRVGDRDAVALHTPGHSNDSVCIYVPDEKVLFAGDTAVNIKSAGGSYTRDYVSSIEKLASLDLKTIYTGHDEPYDHDPNGMIARTLENVLKSRII